MKCVFITGATGVLGSSIVPLFLEEADTRVILLMRADSDEKLRQRLNSLLDFWGADVDASSVAERIRAIRGDVCAPRFGLDVGAYDRLANTVTHIIHSAGNVKLNQSLNDARRSAVDSAESIISFSKVCQQHGQFEKLEFVSTVGIAGATPGLIEERPYSDPRRFHNTYEAAKAEAEALAWPVISNDLPGTIHRPSMIVGDSRTGKIIRFQVFYHLADFLTGQKTWGFIPETHGSKLDIIPVDYVAKAIYISSCCAITAGRILHLTSGPERSWTLHELIAELRRLLEASGQRIPPLRELSPRSARWLYRSVARVVPAKKRRFLQSLPYFLDYLDDQQLFDNSTATELLGRADLAIPRVDRYLKIVMRPYWTPCRRR